MSKFRKKIVRTPSTSTNIFSKNNSLRTNQSTCRPGFFRDKSPWKCGTPWCSGRNTGTSGWFLMYCQNITGSSRLAGLCSEWAMWCEHVL